MHIVACIKQTPATDNIRIDPETGTLKLAAYAVEGDYREILPPLLEELARRRSAAGVA